jgi:hypothetical protein
MSAQRPPRRDPGRPQPRGPHHPTLPPEFPADGSPRAAVVIDGECLFVHGELTPDERARSGALTLPGNITLNAGTVPMLMRLIAEHTRKLGPAPRDSLLAAMLRELVGRGLISRREADEHLEPWACLRAEE